MKVYKVDLRDKMRRDGKESFILVYFSQCKDTIKQGIDKPFLLSYIDTSTEESSSLWED